MICLAYLTDFDDSECIECGDASNLKRRRECVWFESSGGGLYTEKRSSINAEHCSHNVLVESCPDNGPCG